MTCHRDIRHLEEASLEGLPALRSDHYDGWLLRFADGYSRRANSVAPLAPSTIDLDEKIRYCESVNARAGLPCIFKLTEASTPDGLDEALSSRDLAATHRPAAGRRPLLQAPGCDTDAGGLRADP